MSGTVDVGLVPAFVEVVRRGSFTGAAEALGVPKSTVSRHVRVLERQLGTQLLVRTTRTQRLTESGLQFYERVGPSLVAVEEAARELQASREAPRGPLRVTAPVDFDHGLLAGLVTDFAAQYPEVQVELSTSSEVVDLVAEGFDVAIRAGRLPDSTLLARRLHHGVYRLYGSAAYLSDHGMPERVADLGTHRVVLYKSRGGMARWTLHGPAGVEEVQVHGPVSGDHCTFVAAAIEAGAGIGLLPDVAVPEGLRPVLPNVFAPGAEIHIVYPGAQHVPARVRAFRDFMVEEFAARLRGGAPA